MIFVCKDFKNSFMFEWQFREGGNNLWSDWYWNQCQFLSRSGNKNEPNCFFLFQSAKATNRLLLLVYGFHTWPLGIFLSDEIPKIFSRSIQCLEIVFDAAKLRRIIVVIYFFIKIQSVAISWPSSPQHPLKLLSVSNALRANLGSITLWFYPETLFSWYNSKGFSKGSGGSYWPQFYESS